MKAASERGLDSDDLGSVLGLDEADLGRLLNGSLPLDDRLSAALSAALGGSPDVWEALYEQQRSPMGDWLAAVGDYSKQALKALRQAGHVSATVADPPRLAEELTAFFRCAPQESHSLVQAAYRQSTAHAVDQDAVAVWLRLADLQARHLLEHQDVPPLDQDALGALMPTLMRVGSVDPTVYLPEVVRALREVGVVLVFQPDVPGSRLSGAAWPTEAHAVVALTLRGRRDDRFWWTLLHELGHVVLGHGHVVHDADADGAAGDQEAEADAEAKKALVPAGWDSVLSKVSGPALHAVADDLNVPVGVLVGQLHKSKRLPVEHLNALRLPMPDPAGLVVSDRFALMMQPVHDPDRFASLFSEADQDHYAS